MFCFLPAFALHIAILHLMLAYSHPEAPITWDVNEIIPDVDLFMPHEPEVFGSDSFDVTSYPFNDIVIDSIPSTSLQSFCQSEDIFPYDPLQARDGTACAIPFVTPDLVKGPLRALEQLLPPLSPENRISLPDPAIGSEELLENKEKNTCLKPKTHLCCEGPEAPNGAKRLFTTVEGCDHGTFSHSSCTKDVDAWLNNCLAVFAMTEAIARERTYKYEVCCDVFVSDPVFDISHLFNRTRKLGWPWCLPVVRTCGSGLEVDAPALQSEILVLVMI